MKSNSALTKISIESTATIFGRALSAPEWADCRSSSELIQPEVGEFWVASNATAGIYLVLGGKVRLLDGQGELIVTLKAGEIFGAATLFPGRGYREYAARASLNVELLFIPQPVVARLSRSPEIAAHLQQQAQDFDLKIDPAASQASSIHVEIPDPQPPIATKSPPPPGKLPPKIGRAILPTSSQRVQNIWRRATKRYPFFAQQSAADCGAASLVMIAQYWGKKFSINRLRDAANVNRDGASLRGLVAAAESIGFQARPVKASLNLLAKEQLPAIIHWDNNHYVVLYEIGRDRVIIADPAMGQRQISYAELKEKWTGYTVLLEPTAFFHQVAGDKPSLWQFTQLLKPHRVALAEILVASIFLQLFGLITPLLTQIILDRVVVQRSELTLTAVGSGLLLFSLFRIAISGVREYLLEHTANKIDLALIVAFIRHTLKLPLNFFESRYVGDIMSRMQENRKIQAFLSGQALSIFLDLLTVFIYLGLMFTYSWQMGLGVLAIFPLFILMAIISTPLLQKISREMFAASTKESSYLIEVLTGIRTIKSTAVEQQVRWRWEELFNKSVVTGFNSQMIVNRLQIASGTIETCASVGFLWFGASLVIKNQLTIGQLVSFNMLLGSVISPFQRLTQVWNELQEIIIAVERLNDVLNAELEEDLQTQTRQSLPRLRGRIEFRNVTFRYHAQSDTNTIENLSFVVEPGQMLALVGRSGSGKTTVAKLALGLYVPTSGQVLVDGVDITKVSLRSLRQQVGVVDQDTFLFGGTIRDNITLGHPQASTKEVIEAAQLAGADRFITQFPMGYDTQIGEGGGMLSGGQRQRLAIARALLGNPRLLILDEATSSLDSESEQIIQRNLTTVLQGRSSIVIAHRLSTVRNADRILVLDRGILVETGTHNELMAKRGNYFYLNQHQSNSHLPT